MENASEMRKRPTILTILCTLSFISGTWGLMTNLSSFENAGEVATGMIQSLDQAKNSFLNAIKSGAEREKMAKIFADFNILTDTVRIKQNAMFGIMSSILTLVGVSFMYRMRKKGFGIYLLGIGVYVCTPAVVYGLGNLAGVSFFVWSLLVGGIFSLFYWRTIKYME